MIIKKNDPKRKSINSGNGTHGVISKKRCRPTEETEQVETVKKNVTADTAVDKTVTVPKPKDDLAKASSYNENIEDEIEIINEEFVDTDEDAADPDDSEYEDDENEELSENDDEDVEETEEDSNICEDADEEEEDSEDDVEDEAEDESNTDEKKLRKSPITKSHSHVNRVRKSDKNTEKRKDSLTKRNEQKSADAPEIKLDDCLADQCGVKIFPVEIESYEDICISRESAKVAAKIAVTSKTLSSSGALVDLLVVKYNTNIQ